jgi:drug/metabolite transporter (DMT)-like permease
LLLFILSAIWGSAFIAIKISLYSFNPATVASLRLIIASFFLLLFFYFKKNKVNFSTKDTITLIIVGIVGNFIPFFLISWAEQYIQSNIAGLLMSIGPIMTLILAHFFTKDDKFTYLKFGSVIIGFFGVLFILDIKSLIFNDNNTSFSLIPKLAVIFAALGYMSSNILAYNKLEKISSISITTFATLYGAIFSLPFLFFYEYTNPSTINQYSIFSIVFVGLFPTAIAFHFRYYITKNSGPVFLSYVAYLIPVFAIIWGYLILGEGVGYNSITGIFLILIGVYFGQKKLMNKKAN